MRKYQPVWEKIKERKRVTLRVMPKFAARVKKAVIKEKDMDTVFKLINPLDEIKLHISYNRALGEMTFVLKQRFGLEEIHL